MPRLLLVLVLAVLAGCADRMGPPAPYVLHAGAAALSPEPHPDRITVANGDTLYALSRRWGVPMRAIIDANGLGPPYRLVTGTSLAVPQVQSHAVQLGDTLTSVARQYGVDASTLAETNHLAAPYVIRTGEVLVLPAPVQTASQPLLAPAQHSAPSPPIVASRGPIAPGGSAAPGPIGSSGSMGPGTRVLAVSPLATGQGLGAAMPLTPSGVTAEALPAPLAPGGPSQLPSARSAFSPEGARSLAKGPGSQPQPAGLAAAPAQSPAPEQLAAVPPTAPSAPAAVVPPEPPPVPEGAKAPDRLASLPSAGVSAKGFVWPVRGRVISTFGTDSEGIHNDGINIAAPSGTPVLAADSGEVAYAGNELKGYGNLILLKHANGFVSAYAHNDSLLVKRGDRVARGQAIAKVGATGAVDQPQLHFEIRRGAKALDPAEYLPEAAATASR